MGKENQAVEEQVVIETPETTAPVQETPEVKEEPVPEPVFPTKSARIRYLHSKGMKTADIARLMGIRYQHVRNTLERPLKKAEDQPQTSETPAVEAPVS